jgi:hypothetical protein
VQEDVLRLKPGVQMRSLKPQCLFAMVVADEIFRQHAVDLVITSIDGDVHSTGSRHWMGVAFDCRTRDLIRKDQKTAHAKLVEALGVDFDVILESDHIHVEWDPKGPHK